MRRKHSPAFKAKVFHGDRGVVERDSNEGRCSPGTEAEFLAGAPGPSLISALILSKWWAPPHCPLVHLFQTETQAIRGWFGVPGRIRTRDPLLRRQNRE